MGKKQFNLSSFDGLVLNGILWEIENPKAVVFIVHGHGEHIERYEPVAQHFNRHGIAVVGTDLRGHGHSEGKKGFIKSIDQFAEDLNSLIEYMSSEFANIPWVVFGHSMGGAIGLHSLLKDHGKWSAAIISSPWLELVAKPNFIQKITALVGDQFLPQITDHTKLDPKNISSIEEEQEKYANDPLIHDLLSGRLFGEMNRAGQRILTKGERIKIPILISHGLDDEITSSNASKRFSELSKDFELRLWPGVRHEGHNDIKAEETLKSYIEFIEKNI